MGFLQAFKDIIFGGESKKNIDEFSVTEPLIQKTSVQIAQTASPSKTDVGQFELLQIDFDYDKTVRKILKSSNIDATKIVLLISVMKEFGNHGASKIAKELRLVLSDQDFDWPWFDHWLKEFKQHGFPSNVNWQSFADESEWLKVTIWDALKSMKKAELLKLSERKSISVPKDIKVADLRDLLEKRIKRADIIEEIKSAEKINFEKLQKKQLLDKYELLALSFVFFANSLHRHSQLVSLLATSKTKYKIYAAPIFQDQICRKLAKQWEFSANSTDNLPPFFPGDATNLSTKRLL